MRERKPFGEASADIRSNRLVSVCKVLPLSGDRSEVEHFTLSLRLVSKTGELENVRD